MLEYVRAIRVQRGHVSYTVDVTISSTVPSLAKAGILKAIKKQDGEGHPSYEPVSFEGDGMIKTNVIARYLQAEVEEQKPEEKLAVEISPLNYKFTPKGTRQGRRERRAGLRSEASAASLRVVPRHSVGDPVTRLPLMEEGKLRTCIPSGSRKSPLRASMSL